MNISGKSAREATVYLHYRHNHHHHHNHHHPQGLGLFARSYLRVSGPGPSISLLIDLSSFLLLDGKKTASKEFGQLTFLR